MDRHNRTHFYKYISADVAKLIIANQKLKWSSPQSFNDPFDHKFNFLDIDLERLKEKFANALEELIFESNDVIDTSTSSGRMLHEMQQNRNNLEKDKFRATVEEASKNFAEEVKASLATMESEIDDFLSKSRVKGVGDK